VPGVRRGAHLGNLEVIEDGSVFIQGGKIISVGPTRRVENLKETRGAITIPARDCIVMPGFVDPWIQLSLLVPTASGSTGKRLKLLDFYGSSISLMRSCLSRGTLHVGIRACAGVQSMGADVSVLRQLARIGTSPIGQTRMWCPDTGQPDSHLWMATMDVVSRRGLSCALALRGGIDYDAGAPLLAAAKKARMRVSLDWTGGSAMDLPLSGGKLQELLERTAAASVFTHGKLTANECSVLAQSKSIAVFKAGGTLPDQQPGLSVRELADAGGAVALGSGYDALHEPNFDMQLVLALAVRRLGLTIEQAIVAATINAAYAIDCGDQVGSLEPGKRADVLLLNVRDYREIAHKPGVNHVAMAIRDGNIAINRTSWRVGAA
jgi:imidazolonepropionase